MTIVSGLIVFHHAVADDGIYKIVDEDGNVTYSSDPPESGNAVEVIEPLPNPTEEDIEAAKQRQRDIEEEFSKLDQQRAEQAFLEQEARRQENTSVIHNTTVVVGSPGYRYGYHPGYRPGFHPGIGRPGAPVAPGAPTAPGYRPPHATPLPAGPHTRPYRKRRGH
ncbi:MAG: DUF4124 domain-containing protein [Arenicellales bacterium]|nr:DUF4124 domain-containing protein [Arenicellales bacterium]